MFNTGASHYSRMPRNLNASYHIRTRRSLQYIAASVYGGAGGQDTRISIANASSGVFGEVGADQGPELYFGNAKPMMQQLNFRLDSYLQKVCKLKQANSELELKILEFMKKKGPDGRDYSHYEAVLKDLREKMFEKFLENERLKVKIENAHIKAEDNQMKLECEVRLLQTVEADTYSLKRTLDDFTLIQMNLESNIEVLQEEKIFLMKNHDQDILKLRNQLAHSGVHVNVDAPKGQDLAQVLEEMRANYEEIVRKNKKKLKVWNESQITEVQIQVTENTAALKEANSVLNRSRKNMQSLEIELQSQKALNTSIKGTIQDINLRYNMKMEKYNSVIMQLEAELMQLRGNIQQQTQEYEVLLNLKMKLEAEIATYRRLLDGGELISKEAEKTVTIMETMVVMQKMVNRKVVSEKTEIINDKPFS